MSNVFQIFSPAFSDQCRSDDAMILFSIFDHDVLTANDFGGEAFFALKNVPGVQCGNSSVGNFRGLKQVDLPLMFQENKGEETTINVTGGMFPTNGTTSVPLSIPHLILVKVRLLFSSEMFYSS